jgi:hypothetical protein
MMNPNISTATCYKIKSLDEMSSEYKHIFDRDHKQQQQHQMQVVSQHSSFVVVAIVAIHDAFVVAFAVHDIVPTFVFLLLLLLMMFLVVAGAVVVAIVDAFVVVVVGNSTDLKEVTLSKP